MGRRANFVVSRRATNFDLELNIFTPEIILAIDIVFLTPEQQKMQLNKTSEAYKTNWLSK